MLVSSSPDKINTSLPFEIIEAKAKPRKAMRQIVSETERILEYDPLGTELRLAVANHNGDAAMVMDTTLAEH
ncbi:MAG: hypothetical protein MZV70_17385 [Desulfobacterales bacterium]|nr:hypothetical protein [Desulfobacterales bacterium]